MPFRFVCTRIVIKSLFPILTIFKNKVAEDRKYGGLLLFLSIVKIGNSDFITILAHANLNNMIHTTNYCSKPTDNVHRGSLTHIKSP